VGWSVRGLDAPQRGQHICGRIALHLDFQFRFILQRFGLEYAYDVL
jgi:hypothetical protein